MDGREKQMIVVLKLGIVSVHLSMVSILTIGQKLIFNILATA